MAELVNLIKNRGEYVDLMVRGPAKPGTEGHRRLMSLTKEYLTSALQKVQSIPQSDAVKLHTELLRLPLDDESKSLLMSAIDAKVDLGDDTDVKPKHTNLF